MFCHIPENWRGAVDQSRGGRQFHWSYHDNTGLTIQAELDKNASPTGMKVSMRT